MKSPKGFGKRYFSLASILAHSVETKLQSQVSRIESLLFSKILLSDEKEEEEESPPDLVLIQSINIFQSGRTSCHCNCCFKLKTKLATRLHHYIPRCPYYTTYFAFRRTGVHPPHISLDTKNKINKYII